MLPMIRTLWEAKHCLQIMKEEGFERTREFQVWFMAILTTTFKGMLLRTVYTYWKNWVYCQKSKNARKIK
jgi:hypothetical protein